MENFDVNALVAKLETVGSGAFEQLVWLEQVNGGTTMFVGLLFLATVVGGWVLLFKTTDFKIESECGFFAIGTAVLGFLGILLTVMLLDGVVSLAAPEAVVIKQILQGVCE